LAKCGVPIASDDRAFETAIRTGVVLFANDSVRRTKPFYSLPPRAGRARNTDPATRSPDPSTYGWRTSSPPWALRGGARVPDDEQLLDMLGDEERDTAWADAGCGTMLFTIFLSESNW